MQTTASMLSKALVLLLQPETVQGVKQVVAALYATPLLHIMLAHHILVSERHEWSVRLARHCSFGYGAVSLGKQLLSHERPLAPAGASH